MSSAKLIGEFSSGLWIDLGQPSTISAITISGYVTQPHTLGQLNSKIGTCYSSSGFLGTGTIFDVSPSGISNSELAIVGAMYRISFYNQMALRTMGQGGTDTPWSRLEEGDSKITRAPVASVGKEYREMARQANGELNYLVNAFIQTVQTGSQARSIDFLNPPEAPGHSWFQG